VRAVPIINRDLKEGNKKMAQQRIFAGVALRDDELAICSGFGTDPAQYARLLADRRAGKPMVLSARMTNRGKAPSGVVGPPIVVRPFMSIAPRSRMSP
jgi:hypothetical protein